jgi:hypothetical protein
VGPAPGLVTSVTQVNVRLPATVSGGSQPDGVPIMIFQGVIQDARIFIR